MWCHVNVHYTASYEEYFYEEEDSGGGNGDKYDDIYVDTNKKIAILM